MGNSIISPAIQADSGNRALDKYIKSTYEISEDNAKLCDQVFKLEFHLYATRICLAASFAGNVALMMRYRRVIKKY